MGAGAIRKLLENLDLDELSAELRTQVRIETSVQRRKDILKRLKIVEAFRQSGNKPEWMILDRPAGPAARSAAARAARGRPLRDVAT